MLNQYASLFTHIFECLWEIERKLEELGEKNSALPDVDSLRKTLNAVAVCAETVQMRGTKHLAAQLSKTVETGDNSRETKAKISSIRSIANNELLERRFMYVPPERVSYFDNEALCGGTVAEKFPAAIPEIIEAGNCYALERPTACVFHLMRVIPYGMAALAKLLKVKYGQPIKFLQWNQIIDPINNAVTNLQKTKRTPQKLRDQQYFSEVVHHLYFCKDAWRNHVSHSIEPYDMPQARSVMDHVSLIMGLVSKRIKKPFTALR